MTDIENRRIIVEAILLGVLGNWLIELASNAQWTNAPNTETLKTIILFCATMSSMFSYYSNADTVKKRLIHGFIALLGFVGLMIDIRSHVDVTRLFSVIGPFCWIYAVIYDFRNRDTKNT